MNLVGPKQRIVDALDHLRHGIDRIQTLIRVYLAGGVGVARDLPPRAVDRLQTRLYGLNGLVSGHAAQAGDYGLAMQ